MRALLIDCLGTLRGARPATLDVIGAGPRAIAGVLEAAGCDVELATPGRVLRAGKRVLKRFDVLFLSAMSSDLAAAWRVTRRWRSAREGPVVLEAFRRLSTLPEVVLFDGQGIAHPRGLGLAAHLGVLFDLPTVGCAKTRLVGEYQPPGLKKGAMSPLRGTEGNLLGMVVRTRTGVKPVFVSPGHLISVERAAKIVLQLAPRYRLPEVTRLAHHHVNRMRRQWLAEKEAMTTSG